MQIVLNEELKEALEWTCGLVKDYAVDVDVNIYADGEIRISITPTYRDQITPQTEVTTDCRQTDCPWK